MEGSWEVTMALFLILGIGIVIVLSGIFQTSRCKSLLQQQKAAQHIPVAIEFVIFTVQAGELVRVIEHASVVNISAALLLLVIIIASHSGADMVS